MDKISTNATPGLGIISEWEIPWANESGGRRSKILFHESKSSLRITLEEYDRGSRFCRLNTPGWEEMLAWEGASFQRGTEYWATHFILAPAEKFDSWIAWEKSCRLLRIMYPLLANASWISHDRNTQGKFLAKALPTSQLAWKEIPRRSLGDPGSRIAELSRSSDGAFVTSLMDCRSGWSLDEHQHPSSVISYCIRGAGILIGDQNNEMQFGAGQIVVIHAGTPHAFRTSIGGALILICTVPPFLPSGCGTP